jgi:hypothetical protein
MVEIVCNLVVAVVACCWLLSSLRVIFGFHVRFYLSRLEVNDCNDGNKKHDNNPPKEGRTKMANAAAKKAAAGAFIILV